MRQGTLFGLLVLLVLVAAFGWRALGILALVVLLVPVLLVLAIAIGAWVLKRRMTRMANELNQAMRQGQAPAPDHRPSDGPIDVQARVKDDKSA